MDDRTQLKAIAGALAGSMARAANVHDPNPAVSDGSALVPVMALAGPVAHFTVTTPFGYDVRVTVSKISGLERIAGL